MMRTFNIQKQESILNKLETLEHIDINLLTSIINSDKLQTDKYVFLDGHLEYENEKEYLLKIKKAISNNKLKVNYKLGTSGYGRVFPFKGLSLSCVRRQVRHSIAKVYYVDIDMENCQPAILKQLCDLNGQRCELLTYYCDNRKQCLKDVMDYYQVDRNAAKKLFLISQFGGKFNEWARVMNLLNVQPTEFITNYQAELELITNNLYHQNKEVEKAIIKSKKDKNKEFTNPAGTVAAYILQDYERRLLEQVYRYLKDVRAVDMTDCVLCSDGLMISKHSYCEDMLNGASDYVFEKTGFRMNFTEKEMDEDFLDELNKVLHVDPSKTERLDIEYFKTLKSYEHKKQYFEMFVCKVMQPQTLYLFTASDKSFSNDVCMYSEKGIRDCFKQLKSGNYDNQNKETRFIDEWLEDENIKLYDNIDFVPYSEKSPLINNLVYNTFKGFNPLIGSEYNHEKREQILKPFDDLGIEICEGSPTYWSYFKKFLAHMIQKPNERLPIAFIIHGTQGTGKSMLLNTIGNLINDKYYISSANADDFFGTFAEGFLNKLLVNMNETEGHETLNYEGKMKSFITEEKITINQKGIRPFQVNNYARLIITTNKNNPIKIDVTSKDRRYVVFKSTEAYLNKKYTGNFWVKLKDYFKTAGFLSALYDELNEMDIKDYDFTSNRPITNSYKAMRKLYVPTESLFLEDLIENYASEYQQKSQSTYKCLDCAIDIQGTEFYERFSKYSAKYCPQNQVKSMKKFYADLDSLQFPMKIIKPQNKTTYRFNLKECYIHMLNRGWRDQNENDDLFTEEEEVQECDDYDFNLV